MYKKLSLFIFLFSFYAQAQTNATLQIGASRYWQEEQERFKVNPLGPSFLVSLEKSLFPKLRLHYGLYFGLDLLSSDIMADGMENKFSQKHTNYGLMFKYSLIKKLEFIFGLGFSVIDNELEESIDSQSQTALFRVFDLKSEERSGVTTLGIQYNFRNVGKRNKTFINFTQTKYREFDATLYSLNFGFSWGLRR